MKVWISPDEAPQPIPDEVHVWRLSLKDQNDSIDDLVPLLSDEEKTRAAKFRFGKHRNAFIFCRAYLRKILSLYCDCAPSDLKFESTEYGKPYLVPENSLRFNLSHSNEIALYAVSWQREVGIDVEWIHRDLPHRELADRFFTSEEAIALFAKADHLRAFFNCWTRKEAYIKAIGLGLSASLKSFHVSVHSGAQQTIVGGQSSAWTLLNIDAGPDYAAALVGEGKDWHLKLFDAPEGFPSD